MTDSCAISIYKLGRNKGMLFIYFGFWPGETWFIIRFAASITALRSFYSAKYFVTKQPTLP